MRIQIDGQTVEVPDDATDDEINGLFPAPKPELDGAGRVGGFLAKYGLSGAAKGVASIPALAADSVMGVGRDIAYGGKLALSKTGAVEAPDPKNYYGDGPAFPVTTAAMGAADRLGDAATGGLIQANTPGERIAAAGVEGVTGGLAGTGVGSFLARLGAAAGSGAVAQGVRGAGNFLAAEPGVQAASGAAAGIAGTAAGESDVIRDKLPDWAPTAIGMAAGVGTGLGASAVRASLGYDPTSGRYIRSTNTEGQTRLRNQILQGMADDPGAAARNLENRTATEGAADFVFPGYRELTTNAAQDPGLAQQVPLLHKYAGADVPAAMRDNSIAVNRRFINEGAGEGMAQEARDQAEAMSRRDLSRFGLTEGSAGRNPPVRVDDMLAELRARTRGDRPGTTDATRAVNRESANALRAVSERRRVQIGTNAEGEPIYEIQHWATPERLQSVRQDLSESLAPPKPNAPATRIPSAQRARGETGRVMGTVDERIGDNVDDIAGPQRTTIDYAGYLARQRGLRQEADERSFMRALLEDVGPSTDPTTGLQMVQPSKMGRFFNEKNVDRAIPGSDNPSMSIGRLNPARQGFLREAEEVGQVANYSNAPGTGTKGSNTNANNWNEARIANAVREGQAPLERVGDAISRTPFLGPLSRGAGTLFRGGQKSARDQAAETVQRMLGQTVTDRGAAIDALRGPVLPQRGFGISAGRTGVRAGQYTGQSFLAEQRRREERGRRFR